MACVSLGQLHRLCTSSPHEKANERTSLCTLAGYVQDLACCVEIARPDERSMIAWCGCVLQVFERLDLLVQLTNKIGLIIIIACSAASNRMCVGGNKWARASG